MLITRIFRLFRWSGLTGQVAVLAPSTPAYLLLESGDALLLESGDKFLLGNP